MLAEGWIEKQSKTQKKPYYVNSVTKVKTWKRPSSKASNNAGTKLRKPLVRETSYVAPPVDAVLPDGWVQKYSLTKDRVYFFCEELKLTTWQHPSMM